MKRIVYQLEGQPVSILIPCECGLTIEQIGRKDVPVGVQFWIVEANTIPTDREFRDAWTINPAEMSGAPKGIGGTYVAEDKQNDQD